MMVVGDAHQTSLTSSEPYQNPASYISRARNDTTTTSAPSSTSGGASSQSRASSYSLTPTPSSDITTTTRQNGNHIHFRGDNSGLTPQEHAGNMAAHILNQVAQSGGAPPPSPRLEPTHRSTQSLNGSTADSPSRIKVRDLSHIQSFASEEVLTRSRHPSRHSLRGRMDGGKQYEISAMPVADIIEMVAGLLAKITTTNDRQHESLHRNIPPPDGTAGLSSQATSVLAFHGKNVPAITIASYLSRIHKYCPTTYEVFLSLLVYFDRMTEMVNSGSPTSFPDDEQHGRHHTRALSGLGSDGSSETAVNSSPRAAATDSSPRSARAPNIMSSPGFGTSDSQDHPMRLSPSTLPNLADTEAYDLSHLFVVDSFNIHRLVIAGVTCASKFFSDVFYTNSRYAKV